MKSKTPLKIPEYKLPSDGKDVCKIGDFKIDFTNNSKWGISESSKKLYFKLNIKFKNPKYAQEVGLLSNDNDDTLGLGFAVNGVFSNNIPVGNYEVNEEATVYNSYSQSKNLESYTKKFSGKVFFQGNWVALLGYFSRSDKNDVYVVEIYKQFNTNDLDWSLYEFSRTEARQAPEQLVQYLSIFDEKLASFPQEILSYTNLKILEICGQEKRYGDFDKSHRAPINSIPEEIKRLKKLEMLNFSKLSLTHIPESIGKLPNLKKLYLSDNKLTTLPSAILPLTNVELSITNNPLINLPEGFNDVRTDLTLEEKKRLLIWNYKSDNPNTMNENLFNLFHYPKHKEQLSKLIQENPILSKYEDFLLDCTTMATYLIYDEQSGDDVPIGVSKVGGAPDLPQGMAYPTDEEGKIYTFHAQINCAEIAPYQKYLPRKGMLYFYVNDEEFCEHPIVVYNKASDNLKQFIYLETHEWIDSDIQYYKAQKVVFKNAFSLPEINFSYFKKQYPKYAYLFKHENSDEEMDQILAFEDALYNLKEQLQTPGFNNGFNTYTTHAINASVFTQHESPQESAVSEYGGEPSEWMVLLNMKSIGGFSFWDAGTLTYCIHKKDLAIQKFDKIYTKIESS